MCELNNLKKELIMFEIKLITLYLSSTHPDMPVNKKAT